MEDLEQYRQQILSQLKLSVSEQDDLETETDPDIQRLNDQIVRLQQELAKLNQDKANIRAQKADELAEDDDVELEEGDSDLRVGTAQGMLAQIPQDKVAEIVKNLSPEEYQKFTGGLQSDALHAIFNNQGGGETSTPSPEGQPSPEGGEQEAGGEPDLASLL